MPGPRITLDQWNALVSVVESASYAKAGERLHKSQSTLTYAIKKLESLLGVKVFELRGRKAVLTPTGELLYRRAKTRVRKARRIAMSKNTDNGSQVNPPATCPQKCRCIGVPKEYCGAWNMVRRPVDQVYPMPTISTSM